MANIFDVDRQNNTIAIGKGDTATMVAALTASKLMASDGSKIIGSSDLVSWVTGVANEINITDDGDGTITIGIVNPLIVAKGGTGLATITDHGILLGSGTNAITPLGVATNGQLPIGSTGADPILAGLTGTANQIISTPGAGSITLSTPQDIHTGANPTFAGLNLSDDLVFTTTKGIRQSTSDASDDQSTYLAGGGAFGNSRGACLVCYGNEVGETPGKLYLYGGNVANGDIICNVENSERLRVRVEGILVSGDVENAKIKLTSIGGYAVKLTNKTGNNSVAGELVNAHTSVENAVEQTATDDTIPIGSFLDSGVADGSEAWVVVGGIAQVLIDSSTTVAVGDWVKVSSNDAGRCESSGNEQPGVNHFREIGHALEAGGNNELIKIAMHFN